MHSRIAPIDAPRNGANPQSVETKTKVTCIQVPIIQERICYKFARGVLERYIASEMGVRREFIEAVLRRDHQRLLAENAALRSENAALRQKAA